MYYFLKKKSPNPLDRKQMPSSNAIGSWNIPRTWVREPKINKVCVYNRIKTNDMFTVNSVFLIHTKVIKHLWRKFDTSNATTSFLDV